MEDEEQFVLEAHDDALAETLDAEHLFSVGGESRRIEGSQQMRAGDPQALELPAYHARPHTLHVDRHVRKLWHDSDLDAGRARIPAMEGGKPGNREQRIALALTGGGARGAYQAGVLAGIADRAGGDACFPIITGVSAGAINAATLASHRGDLVAATQQLREAWLNLRIERVFRSSVGSLSSSLLRWSSKLLSGGAMPFQLRGLLDTAPLREYLTNLIDFSGIDDNIRAGRLRALALSMTGYATGCTVTFVHGDREISDWERAHRMSVRACIGVEHVMASAALPMVFPAIQVGEEYFGDGSIRHAAPLAPAVHLGADRIVAISVRYGLSEAERAVPQVSGYPPPAQILGMMMHGVFLDALENDAERLVRINRTLSLLPPGTKHPEGLRPVQILLLRPSEDLGKLSAGLVHTLPRALRILARGLGATGTTTPDFLSYLLFEPPYTERLMEIGFNDARAQWDRIESFLAGP